ncbi:mannose-1-phosphate guanylyltransferase/mannose-6-phosphate isomerase [Kushneria sinocarnis]|uniref:mannose-1-phosphate guanylyltransferase n=1 Tax=Kushneria sinocarnis TaxID=595502 RepID=A0A420WX28_9GAMM|nr:mannose-1-phosphate guanylyltransferase/mannose-6-phosphate isomerase [Kushneria sinocarnis]RKR04243.1 mannose-1-phosphate guanylyltransferase/mannose-6-phosphate isomerase [Kushneria sinocarnis]
MAPLQAPHDAADVSPPLTPVILSGGAGTRLWPLSRQSYPKQFLPLLDPHLSLLQQTLSRLEGVPGIGAPLMICNEAHRFLVAEQLRDQGITPGAIVLEPAARNTAPALALAALSALEGEEEAMLLIMPADHQLEDTAAFRVAVEEGRALAGQGRLVTFGVVPTRAHTGYGYIRAGEAAGSGYRVETFTEKPDQATAEQYLAAGDYYWNSGMFLMRARTLIEELARHAPEVLAAAESAWAERRADLDFTRVACPAFEAAPNISIDYAVMERTNRAVMVALEAGWSDIGAWDAVFEAQAGQQDEAGNVVQGDVLLHETRNSFIASHSRLVATLGLSDIIAVETEDAVLLANRHRMQELGALVERLGSQGRSELRAHRRVYRPWGYYRTMVCEPGFQVKEIMVHPGAALSLQMHHHRAEHWVVVQGTAQITQGEQRGDTQHLETRLITEDESTYIPLATVHRLENPGRIPLRLIEVQTGRHLDEADIVRFEDRYQRQG